VAPLLLIDFVAGVHQFHLGAGHLLLRTGKAVVAAQRGSARPQVGAQARGAVDQRCVHGQRLHATFHADDELFAFGQRLLREGAAVVAVVFVKAHVQPALRLAEVVVTHRAAPVVEALDAALQRLVGLVVGLYGRVTDARGSGCQLGRCCGVRRLRGLRKSGRSGQAGQQAAAAAVECSLIIGPGSC
jgi:hypothetical protein